MASRNQASGGKIMSLWVADISAHNPNYAQIIKDNDAVIVKVTEGLSYVNPLANAQIEATLKANKGLGLYHFIVGGLDVKAQAQYFYNNAKNYIDRAGVVVILDWEKPSGYPSLSGNEPKVFLDELYRLTGKRGLNYISHSDFISPNYEWSDITPDYSLWVAGYPVNKGDAFSSTLQQWADTNYFSNARYKNAVVAMWQYDSVPYDRSIFYGDMNAWKAYGTKNGKAVVSKPAPSNPAPAATPNPAPVGSIQQFKNVGNHFTNTGTFTVDKIENINGMWQMINYNLAGGKDADWTLNGIPLDILDNVTRGNNAPTQVGDKMKFASGYDNGTIDKYDQGTNGVGIVFGNYGIVWFNADAFIKL